MKFFSRKLSERLQSAGCISESGFLWCFIDNFYDVNEWKVIPSVYKQHHFLVEDYDYGPAIFEYKQIIQKLDPRKLIQAFGWFDLCVPSELARENAKIIWPEHDIFPADCSLNLCRCKALYYDGGWSSKHDHKMRHTLIDLPEDEVEAYVANSLTVIDGSVKK